VRSYAMNDKSPDSCRDLESVVDAALNAKTKQHANLFYSALNIALEISRYLNGERVYIPNRKKVSTAELHMEIFDRFNGTNSLSLSKEYGLSQRQIQHITACERARRKKERDAARAG
jgi:Mor family transcriptional regulator